MANIDNRDWDTVTVSGTTITYIDVETTYIGGEIVIEIIEQVVEGGDLNWRGNNPLAIQSKSSGEYYAGQIGVSGNGVPIFKSEAAGETANRVNLFDNDHSTWTVEERIAGQNGQGGWAEAGSQQNYVDYVEQELGSEFLDLVMGDLTPTEQDQLYDVMYEFEGGDPGTVNPSTTTTVSPLAIDLDGDGIETLPASDGVSFDFDADGAPDGAGWLDADDAFLVLDLDGNGQIDSGREMFGNSTLMPDGRLARNGYEALSQHDDNGDGVIDADDAVFRDLELWRDLDADGETDPNELSPLARHGIESIDLDYGSDAELDANGNVIALPSEVHYRDSSIGQIADVWFDTIDPVGNRVSDQDLFVNG